MHRTALIHAKLFFETYVREGSSIVEIGSQDVNGSLRSVAPDGSDYTGVDFADALGVDVVISDPYKLPFEDGAFDVCVSSSCFEHSEFFWLTFLETLRVLKPGGLLYLNVPSNGPFHRYPVDCWRFYPDSGEALANWGRRNGHNVELLESFVGKTAFSLWNDYVAVFSKGGHHPNRMQDVATFVNGSAKGRHDLSNFSEVMPGSKWLESLWGMLRQRAKR